MKFIITSSLLLLFLTNCGLNPSPEIVAKSFLTQVYQLNYDNIEKLATDDALLQIALLQGRLDALDEELKLSYTNRSYVVDKIEAKKETAKVFFTTVYFDGTEEENSLTLKKIKGKWMVVSIEKSPAPPVQFFFNS